MNSKELLEQAEQRIAEVESIKILVSSVNTLTQIISEVQRPVNDICMGELTEETNISGAIGAELNIRLKSAIAINLTHFLSEKNNELEKLLGIRKPAFINPEFEKAIKEMENTGGVHKKTDPVEEKLADLLQNEAKKIEDKPIITEVSLDKYPAKRKEKRIVTPENMTEADVRRMYIDEGMNREHIAAHYGLTTSKINNFLFLHDIKRNVTRASRPDKQPEETERP